MPYTLRLVEGWTKPIEFQLLDGGVPANPPNGLTGCTVSALIRDNQGNLATWTTGSSNGRIEVSDAATCKVKLLPSGSGLQSSGSPYHITWQVIDALGLISHFPNTAADVIEVRPA